MQLGERIKRGFWRIGLVGAAVGATTAIAGLIACAYVAIFVGTTKVYVPEIGHSIEVSVDPTFEEVQLAIKALPIDWSKALADGKDVIITADKINRIRMSARNWRMERFGGPLDLATGGAGFGILWLGFWQLLSWLIRGFLD